MEDPRGLEQSLSPVECLSVNYRWARTQVARHSCDLIRLSPGGLTSKIHVVVDGNGLPVRIALTAGEAHDNLLAAKLLSRLKSGAMLLSDRG
jgi:hypothetical protein